MVLDVVPTEFGAERDRETGGDQIAEWQMRVGQQTFGERELVTARPAPWTSGDPVVVTLRVASDSPYRPVTGTRTVLFMFSGAWALFGLLRNGQATAEGFGIRPSASTVLGFQIPVEATPTAAPPPQAGSPFKVFMRLRVSQAGTLNPLPFEGLPAKAPLPLACSGL